MAVVREDERTLASGATHLVRMAAWAVPPAFAGLFVEHGTAADARRDLKRAHHQR